MPLTQTTILPTDDPALARRMLEELIHEEPLVLLVVQGADDVAERTVRRADKLASLPRWVVWARHADDIAPVRETLQGDPDLIAELADAQAFALSLSDTVQDVIRAEEPAPDLVRLLLAFLRAEEDLP